ncbi:hypothetical protein Fmac_014732 [Flemingia macrophylla]|uniref:Uncharacterized protein n=1 Tax=Flemingia macrophylla TaxID=520843 RepID=A0ABD1MCJ4_9FABA
MRIIVVKGNSFQKSPIQEYGKRATFASFVLQATNALPTLKHVSPKFFQPTSTLGSNRHHHYVNNLGKHGSEQHTTNDPYTPLWTTMKTYADLCTIYLPIMWSSESRLLRDDALHCDELLKEGIQDEGFGTLISL